MKKLRIAIDMDDVILDLVPEWVQEYKRILGIDSSYKIDVNEWDITKSLDLMPKEELFNILNKRGFFYNCPPVFGAIHGIKRLLSSDKYYLFILTACDFTYSYKEKVDWITKYFGQELASRVIGVKHGTFKNDLHDVFDVIVDDCIYNMERIPKKEKKIKILFDRPYNRHIDSSLYTYRAYSWGNLIERLDTAWQESALISKI